MNVNELSCLFPLICVQHDFDDVPVTAVYASDLLSDVLAHASDHALLVTVQAHKNTVAVASMKGSPAIVICCDRPLPDDMIAAAASEHIGLFVTEENQYTVSGRIYGALVYGIYPNSNTRIAGIS